MPRLAARLGVLVVLALGLRVTVASSQILIPDERPGDERLEIPKFVAPGTEEGPILPPLPIPRGDDTAGLEAGTEVMVRAVRISGNTAISADVLREIAAPYEGKRLSFADLLELRERLTLAYVDRGFVTSGAVLPEQRIVDGVVSFQIVEGALEDVAIAIEGLEPQDRFRPGHFQQSYLRDRIAPDTSGPLNVFALERRLQLLQQDSRIHRVQARLVPSDTRGLANLHVFIEEEPPWTLGAEFNNYRHPSIGAFGGDAHASYENVIGLGDGVLVHGAVTDGLRQLDGSVHFPLTTWDTLFTLRGQWSEASVVAEPVASELDIESRSRTVGFELRQPLYRTLHTTVETYLRGELRRSKSLLDGQGFSFIQGPDDGGSEITVSRLGIEWSRRSRFQALALRSLFSLGLDAFGATKNRGDIPDGEFFAWLGQAQWVVRLPWLDSELLIRTDVQLAADPLLPLEQFAMGGRYTVRGYRENTLVRDNGVAGSIEGRLPIFARVEPHVRVDLIPFVDAGYSWNTSRDSIGPQTLASVGIGSRISFTRWTYLEIFWGHRIEEVDRIGEYDLQDDGIHLRVSVDLP